MLKNVTKKLKPFIEKKLNEEYLIISSEANLYCLNYIEARFKRLRIDSGLEFVSAEFISEKSSAISLKIIQIGELLETAYPYLYHNVSKHLKIRLRSEVIVGDVFRTFGRELFRDGVSWAKVIALFAFAASMSEDCVMQGRPELVKSILNNVRAYVRDHLAVWIRNHGGWGDVMVIFKCIEKQRSLFFLARYYGKVLQSWSEALSNQLYTTAMAVYEFIELLNFG